MIDNRRAITIGSALIVGLSFDDLFHALNLSPDVKTVFSSALLTSVIVAIFLTGLFRIGVRQSVVLDWNASDGDAPLKAWIASNGKLWIARTELIQKAQSVLEEFAQAAPELSASPVRIAAHYDEVSLKLDMTWKGSAFREVSRGKARRELDPESAGLALHLAAVMIRHITDHVSQSKLPDGYQRLSVTLDDL